MLLLKQRSFYKSFFMSKVQQNKSLEPALITPYAMTVWCSAIVCFSAELQLLSGKGYGHNSAFSFYSVFLLQIRTWGKSCHYKKHFLLL